MSFQNSSGQASLHCTSLACRKVPGTIAPPNPEVQVTSPPALLHTLVTDSFPPASCLQTSPCACQAPGDAHTSDSRIVPLSALSLGWRVRRSLFSLVDGKCTVFPQLLKKKLLTNCLPHLCTYRLKACVWTRRQPVQTSFRGQVIKSGMYL